MSSTKAKDESSSVLKFKPKENYTAEEIQLCNKLITTAKIQLINFFPFFGFVTSRLKFILDNQIGTMCTNGRTIRVGTAFLLGLKEEYPDKAQGYINFIICHEILHGILFHCDINRIRNHDVIVSDKNGNPISLWNIATDYVVNYMIWADVKEISPKTVDDFTSNIKHAGNTIIKPDFGLFDEKYNFDFTAEKVYNELLKEMNNNPKDKNGNRMLKVGNGSLLDDHAEGQKKGDADKQQTMGNGEVDDADGTKSTGEYWKEITGQALMQCKQQGKLPSGLERIYNELFAPPKIKWYEELRNYLYSIDGYNYRDIPPNKRHRKVMLPSVYGEEIKFTFVADTSGSMTEKHLMKAADELEGIFSSFESCKVRVMACDAAIHSDEIWEGYSSLKEDVAKMKKMFKGGGGTDFRPVFECQEEDTTVLIFFTDGYGEFPAVVPPYDVIWIRCENDLPAEKFPFGRVLTITESNS